MGIRPTVQIEIVCIEVDCGCSDSSGWLYDSLRLWFRFFCSHSGIFRSHNGILCRLLVFLVLIFQKILTFLAHFLVHFWCILNWNKNENAFVYFPHSRKNHRMSKSETRPTVFLRCKLIIWVLLRFFQLLIRCLNNNFVLIGWLICEIFHLLTSTPLHIVNKNLSFWDHVEFYKIIVIFGDNSASNEHGPGPISGRPASQISPTGRHAFLPVSLD